MTKKPIFEFYVLKYDINKGKIILFNIFDNRYVYDEILDAINKFYETNLNEIDEKPALLILIDSIKNAFKHEYLYRRQYEISVGDAFEVDCRNLQKFDVYKQIEMNFAIILKLIAYQYDLWKGR